MTSDVNSYQHEVNIIDPYGLLTQNTIIWLKFKMQDTWSQPSSLQLKGLYINLKVMDLIFGRALDVYH